ncbi:MAG: ABC transporter permease [Candidatus Diapherotrites archaeon]|nr:ABC transporter permease [Candidatus Diapherotrites archaeon]
MSFFEIVLKEISLVKNQRIALLLIILYPLLVVGLVGTSFTGVDISKLSQNKVGFVNNLSFDSNFSNMISSIKDVTILEYDDVNLLSDAIKKREVMAGIRISGESKYSQIKVDMYFDNSSLLASKLFVEIAKATVQRVTTTRAQEELGKLWGTISDLGKNVGTEIDNVSDFKARLSSAEESLNNLEVELDKIDFNSIEQGLLSQKASVDEFSQSNQDFAGQVAGFKTSFLRMKSEITDLNTQLGSYRSEINDLSSQIDSTVLLMDSTIVGLASIRSSLSTDSAKAQLDSQIASLSSARSNLVSLKPVAQRITAFSDELSNSNSSLNNSIAQADSLFNKLDAESANVSSALNSSSAVIGDASTKLSVFKSSMTEVRTLISDSRESKKEIESRLGSSEELLSSFSAQLKEFSDINPKVLAQPAVFYEKTIFDTDPFGILVANSVSVVLILTCMLLTSMIVLLEKNQKVSLRFDLSITSRAKFLFGKICGQLVIALIEAAVIFSVAFAKIPLPFAIGPVKQLGFGLSIASPIWELFLAMVLISIAFISIGILISFFTKNQSTAILTSLLIIVPMLFLSGVILPIEFMEPFMQFVSSVLPLTVANNLLIGLMIKGMPLVSLWYEITFFVVFSLAVVCIVLFKKK